MKGGVIKLTLKLSFVVEETNEKRSLEFISMNIRSSMDKGGKRKL